MRPEAQARLQIDAALTAAGWAVQDRNAANLHAGRGVAIREFPLRPGYGHADYLLYVDGKAVGVVEAKAVGATLTGVEIQTGRYSQGMPAELPKALDPLPFLYESTGVETVITRRQQLLTDGSLTPEGEHLVFTRDVEFKSPSGAASVIHGGGANGLVAWKDQQGVTLKAREG